MDESIFFFAFRDPNRIDFPVFRLDVHGVVVTLNTLDVVKASDIKEDEVADFFCNASVDDSELRLDFSEERRLLTSFRAAVFVALALCSLRIRFCGARLTSMSWSTMDFQSNPEANPDSANPIRRESAGILGT